MKRAARTRFRIGRLKIALLILARSTANDSLLGTFSADIESGVARRVGERLDATVIFIALTIESDGRNAGGERAFGDELADHGGGFDVSAVLVFRAEISFVGAGARERLAHFVVDDLRANMARATEYAKSRTNADFFHSVRDSEFASPALFIQTELFSHCSSARFSIEVN